jgi:hypothetical protein
VRSAVCCLPAVVVLLVPRVALAQDTDCRGLVLVAATGVPAGTTHTYQFQGTCKLLGKLGSFFSPPQWTRAQAEWNAVTGTFHERVVTEGKYAGTIEMWLKCAKDPVVTSVTCVQVNYRNPTGWSGFDGAWHQRRPITRGKTTLAEATILSHQAPPLGQPVGGPGGSPPSGDKPATEMTTGGKTTRESASSMITLEAEALMPNAQLTHGGGQVGRQDMTQFGPGWGGNAQLFWSVNVIGAQLRLGPTVPSAGRYQVFVVFTKAPDFGRFKASFDGKTEITVDGYAATVGRDRAFLGEYDLTAEPHELLITVVGRDHNSKGFYVGLDRIEFKSVP